MSIIKISSQKKGMLFALLAGISYGFLGYLGMSIMNNSSSFVFNMLFWRFFSACVIFLICLLIFPQKNFFHFKGSSIKVACLLAGFFNTGASTFFFLGSNRVGTGLSMVIISTYPAITAILNWILYRQKINKYYYFSFLFISLGVFLLAHLEGTSFSKYGILLALFGALNSAAYTLASKNQVKNLSPLVSSFIMSSICSMCFLLLAISTKEFFIPTTFFLWAHIVGIGVISTVLPIFFMFKALQYISATKEAIISTIEIIITILLGILLLGETINTSQLLGMGIVLLGIFIIQFDKSKVS